MNKTNSGEADLKLLLKTLQPERLPGEFVFLTFEGAAYGAYPELNPLGAFTEGEGLSLIVPRDRADHYKHAYESVYSAITLTVHSSLDAVGLSAAIAHQLTEHNISCNIVAARYHDHVFVPTHQAKTALSALISLQTNALNH
ncbi:MAG: ACT domain-containing protein [Granulosicoccus sp.]|nr:ACT domain-containing protein [Granulosicoccus sp.]